MSSCSPGEGMTCWLHSVVLLSVLCMVSAVVFVSSGQRGDYGLCVG